MILGLACLSECLISADGGQGSIAAAIIHHQGSLVPPHPPPGKCLLPCFTLKSTSVHSSFLFISLFSNCSLGDCSLSKSSRLLGVQNAGSSAGKSIVCKRTGDNQHAKKWVSREGEREGEGEMERERFRWFTGPHRRSRSWLSGGEMSQTRAV